MTVSIRSEFECTKYLANTMLSLGIAVFIVANNNPINQNQIKKINHYKINLSN